MTERETKLANAAEQFLAILGDGNLESMTEYLEDIFRDALATEPEPAKG